MRQQAIPGFPAGGGVCHAAAMQPFLHTGIFSDPACRAHATPLEHPECPARFDAALQGLWRSGLMDLVEQLPGRPATDEELQRCHTPSYIRLVRDEIAAGAIQLSTGDTFVGPSSWEAALMAAGLSLSAVEAVYAGRVKNAFCIVRPPGHHATAGKGMGFCIFNNAALAARHAQQMYGAKRVLIVDWDVHHGNGTQDIFYADGSVFYFSVHQAPLYPGTGHRGEHGIGEGEGTTLNVPVPAGTPGSEITAILRRELVPAMKTFQPEFVVISAGFDARIDDPLGGLRVTDHDFADQTALVLDLAKEHAGGRVVSILEGGYNLSGLASAVAAHVQVLVEHV